MPVFAGTRVPVQALFDYLEGGETLDAGVFKKRKRTTRQDRSAHLDILAPRPRRTFEESPTRLGAASRRGRAALAIIANAAILRPMGTMNISLPEALKAFVEEQVAAGGYSTTSEYVRELIRREQDRAELRSLLLEGATSSPTTTVDRAYFRSLRDEISGARRE
jgi:antitoxin ParD1/3/4